MSACSKSFTHSFLRVFMFQSCRLPSEKPTASWLVRWMYCRAVAPVPVGLLSWRQRCLPCCVTPSRNRGISDGDLLTTSRSVAKTNENGLRLLKGVFFFTVHMKAFAKKTTVPPEASSSLWLQDRSSRQRSTSSTWPTSVTTAATPKNQRRLWCRCCVLALAPP